MRADLVAVFIARLVAGIFGIEMVLTRVSFHDFSRAGDFNPLRE